MSNASRSTSPAPKTGAPLVRAMTGPPVRFYWGLPTLSSGGSPVIAGSMPVSPDYPTGPPHPHRVSGRRSPTRHRDPPAGRL